MTIQTYGSCIRQARKGSSGPVDALRDLISGKITESAGHSYRITRISDKDSFMVNGIRRCFVEVTFSNEFQYGIEAYGEDAEELYYEALSVRSGSI